MLNKLKLLMVVVMLFSAKSYSSTASYVITPDSLYKHISVLADDSLEGREVGEIGSWKAAKYIKNVFQSCNLKPKGIGGSYLQPFEFTKRIDFGPHNKLVIDKTELKLNDEFVPLKQSASKKFKFDKIINVNYGITVDTSDGVYDDYKNKDVTDQAVIIKRFAPSSDEYKNINFDKHSSLTDKINNAINHKASGIFLITPKGFDDTLKTLISNNFQPQNIPIILLRNKALKHLGITFDNAELKNAFGETELVRVKDTGYNVIGYIPTDNDTIIIIGAHYDHLGWGTPASHYHGKVKMIHNGADDNASGVSALLEIARYYQSQKDKLKYSLLFISFSGEEAGLLGSTYFVHHMTIDSNKVRMMINMDMIGRLRDQKDGLFVFGLGTCQPFKNYFDSVSYKDIKLTLKETGVGPSDQMPFYLEKIPILYFFTGAHKDYHMPTDDIDKIDPEGIVKVTEVVRDAIDYFNHYDGPLVFHRTKGAYPGKHHSQYTVTLGIIPDYAGDVTGLKIDGIMPERPAEKGGIQEGDIIIKMGTLDIKNIYDYMNALSKFHKGDSTTVVVKRGSDTLSLPITF